MKIDLFRVKKNKLEKLMQWGNSIATAHKDEALETLEEEGLIYESCFIFQINGKYYGFAISEGEYNPTNMRRKFNQIHKAIKQQCVEEIGRVEKVYEIFNKVKIYDISNV